MFFYSLERNQASWTRGFRASQCGLIQQQGEYEEEEEDEEKEADGEEEEGGRRRGDTAELI